MAEYIKREAAIREIEQINPVDYGAMWDYEAHHWAGECLRDCKEVIDSIPAADVASVVHAEWVVCGDGDNVPWMCSHCGKTTAHKYKVIYGKYCPNCGAKMDGGDGDAAD